MNPTDKLARVCRTAMAVLIVFLALGLMSTLTGCMTTYSIDKKTDGSILITIKSFREFTEPKIVYNRDGQVVGFAFNAASATTAVSPIEQAIADGIRTGAFVLGPPGAPP